MNILCLDASLSSTGYAIFKNNRLEKYGKICPDNKDRRLLYIYEYIKRLIEKERIDKVIIEDGFVKMANLKTGLQLAELRGCIKLLCLILNKKLITVAPQQIKKAITGKGNCTKEDVFNELKQIYKYDNLIMIVVQYSEEKNDIRHLNLNRI